MFNKKPFLFSPFRQKFGQPENSLFHAGFTRFPLAKPFGDAIIALRLAFLRSRGLQFSPTARRLPLGLHEELVVIRKPSEKKRRKE